jgi:hypothetical protein
MPITFLVKKAVVPPVETWYEATDNTYWQAGIVGGEPTAEWVGEGSDYWQTVAYNEGSTHRMQLKVKSGTNWAVDFRPTKIRITHTADVADVGTNQVQVRIVEGGDLGSGEILGSAVWSTFTSPGIIELTYVGKGDPPTFPADIDILWLNEENPSAQYTVTKIEFNADPGDPVTEIWYSVLKDDGGDDWWNVTHGTWNSEDNQWEFADIEGNHREFIFWNAFRGWGDDFRPSKIRITGTVLSGVDPTVYIYGDGSNTVIGSETAQATLIIEPNYNGTTYTFRGIGAALRLEGTLYGGFSIITNIEVNADPGEVTLA